ncbi:MAG: condensation domain-containing protein [Actinomycetota bacterium]
MGNRLEGFVVPASSAQRRMYFATALRPDDPAHIWGTALTVDGHLEIDRLDRALKVIRRRHGALRTTILEHDGDVFQVVHDPDEFDPQFTLVEFVVAEGESIDDRRECAHEEVRRAIDTPFDLVSGPLWRTVVIRVAPTMHLLAISFHHIITDEVSAQVFADDLRLAYTDPDSLTASVTQYSDYCRAESGAGVDHAGLDYWRDQLASVRPVRPPEDGDPRSHGAVGGCLPIALPENAVVDLEAFCRERGVSPFAGMLAVYFIVLQRWGGTP